MNQWIFWTDLHERAHCNAHLSICDISNWWDELHHNSAIIGKYEFNSQLIVPLLETFRLRLAFLSLLHILRRKFQANRVDTMSLICRSLITFSLEDMSQMATTITAHNFGPLHSKGSIGMTRHSPGNAVEVGGPSTAALEFVLSCVEWCITTSTGVDTSVRLMLVVFSGSRSFSTLLAKDTELF